MPLRIILRYLANNEHLINKIAESYPIRRAAQWSVYLFNKSKGLGQDKIQEINKFRDSSTKDGDSVSQFSSFKARFGQELKDGLKEINDKFKQK